jgi:O-antigen/teichoic acid export membrane protein
MKINVLRKYFTNTVFLNLPSVVSAVITLISLPIILANLSISDYGKWQFIISVQSWFSVFGGINIIYASKKGIANELRGTFIYGFLLSLRNFALIGIFIIILSGISAIMDYPVFPELLLIAGFYSIFGYLFQVSSLEYLIAKKRFREWCFWQIIIYSISVFGSTAVAFYSKNIIYFAFYQLGSVSVLSFGLWLWIVRKEGLLKSYRRGEIDKECVPFGMKLIPVDVASITAASLSSFIIGPFLGFANLAVFSIANKLREKSANLMKSVRPLLYADFAKIEQKDLIVFMNRIMLKVGAFGIFLTSVFMVLGWSYVQYFLPREFQPAVIYFVILALGLPSIVLVSMLHTILESHLRYKEIAILGIVPNLIKILLVITFGYFWHIFGICVALTLSVWITFCFYYILTMKKRFALRIINKCAWVEELSRKY